MSRSFETVQFDICAYKVCGVFKNPMYSDLGFLGISASWVSSVTWMPGSLESLKVEIYAYIVVYIIKSEKKFRFRIWIVLLFYWTGQEFSCIVWASHLVEIGINYPYLRG